MLFKKKLKKFDCIIIDLLDQLNYTRLIFNLKPIQASHGQVGKPLIDPLE